MQKERDAMLRSRELLQKVVTSGDYGLLFEQNLGQLSKKASISSRTLSQQQQNIPMMSTSSRPSSVRSSPGSMSSAGAGVGGITEDIYKVFDALETNRRELLARNHELELQVQDLLANMQNAQNNNNSTLNNTSQLSSPDSPVHHHSSKGQSSHQSRPLPSYPHPQEHKEQSSKSIQVLRVEYDELLDSLHHLQQQHTDMHHKLLVKNTQYHEQQDKIQQMQHAINTYKERIGQLHHDLQSRPSLKAYNQVKYNLQECETKLSHYILYYNNQGKVEKSYKQHLPTQDAMRIDKLNHALHLYGLDDLSKDILLDIIKSICRELHLQDITDIQPCIQKLKAAMLSIPIMEKYIIEVNSYIQDRNNVLDERLGYQHQQQDRRKVQDGMEEVKKILTRWWSLVQQSVELAKLREKVLLELYRGQVLLQLHEESKGGRSSGNLQGKGFVYSIHAVCAVTQPVNCGSA